MVVLGQSLAQKRFCQFCDFHVVVYHLQSYGKKIGEDGYGAAVIQSWALSRNGQGTHLSELNIQVQ